MKKILHSFASICGWKQAFTSLILLLLAFFSSDIIAADLEITLAAMPLNPSIYTNTTITAVATNTGMETMTSATIDLAIPQGYAYVSSSADNSSYFSWLGKWELQQLNPGEQAMVQITLFSLTMDPTTVNAQLSQSSPPDNSPGNNTAVIILNDDGSGQQEKADLVVHSVIGPALVTAGDTIAISSTVKNIGAAASSNCSLGYFLSNDNILSSNDISLGTESIPTLQPFDSTGQDTVNLLRHAIIPSNLSSGTYYLILKADADDAVAEENEVNNTNHLPVSVTGVTTPPGDGVDLELSLSANPVNPSIYSNVTFTLTVLNNGTDPASAIAVLFPTLPSGLVFTSQNVPGGTTFNFWEGLWTIPALGAGQSMSLQLVLFTLNTDQVSILSEVIACSQPDADSSPGNNTSGIPQEDDEAVVHLNSSGPAPVLLPDLIVGVVSTDSRVSPGDFFTFDIKARNVGTGDAGAHHLKYYLSTNNSLSGDDLLLGTESFSGIPAQSFIPIIESIEIPDSTQDGNYFIIFAADAENEITESNESNNLTIKPLQITSGQGASHGIDLELALESDPGTISIYTYVTFTLTAYNYGPDEATSVLINFPIPQGLAYHNVTASTGNYNVYFQNWEIPSIAADSFATLELTLFTLQANPVTAFAQVMIAGQHDADSTPGNNQGMTPGEDDEVALTINPPGLRPRNTDLFSDKEEKLVEKSFSVYKVYPNPAVDEIKISFFSKTESLDYGIYDSQGRQVMSGTLQDAEGFHERTFDISTLQGGMHYFLFKTRTKAEPIRFVKVVF